MFARQRPDLGLRFACAENIRAVFSLSVLRQVERAALRGNGAFGAKQQRTFCMPITQLLRSRSRTIESLNAVLHCPVRFDDNSWCWQNTFERPPQTNICICAVLNEGVNVGLESVSVRCLVGRQLSSSLW